LTLWYELFKKQGHRDESIQTLASFMRDMLASLSEVKDLRKIEMLRSVIKIALRHVDECAKFIESYAQHIFWGEFARCLAVTCLIDIDVGRFVRQSLSSHTANTIQWFQNAFAELKQKVNDAVSIQTLRMVAETHRAFEVMNKTLSDLGDGLVAQADRGRHFLRCATAWWPH
jgi:hypothetical protein